MTLSEPVVESQRSRVTAAEQVGKTTGLGWVGGFLFGLLFVAVGVAIALVGVQVIPVDPGSVHAPYWVLTCFGGIFAGGGLLVWGTVLQSQRLKRRRRAEADRHPGSEVFADYPWDPLGVRKSPWPAAVKAIATSLFLAFFLIPFNWWAWFSAEGVAMVRGIVVLFDLLLLLSCYEALRRLLAALKYGPSGLEYATFPARTGGRVELRWLPPSGLEGATRVRFVLRGVEEWQEVHGAGKNRSVQLIHEQLWAATRTSEGPVVCRSGFPVELAFEVPASAPGSRLSAAGKIVFWELAVSAEAPGVDFQESYLVPVYPG